MVNRIRYAGLEVVASYNQRIGSRLSRCSIRSYTKDGMYVCVGATDMFQDTKGNIAADTANDPINLVKDGDLTLKTAPGFSNPVVGLQGNYRYVNIDPATSALQFPHSGTYNLYFMVPGNGVLRSANVPGPFLLDFPFHALAIVPSATIDCNEVDLIAELTHNARGLASLTLNQTLFQNNVWQDAYIWDDTQTIGETWL